MCQQSDRLSCVDAKWIGLHPTDINKHFVSTQQLTEHDKKIGRGLLERGYIRDDDKLMREVGDGAETPGVHQRSTVLCVCVSVVQVKYMMDSEVKAEIEGLSGCGTTSVTQVYTSHYYLPGKIQRQQWI